MQNSAPTAKNICELVAHASECELIELEQRYSEDPRAGVRNALKKARRRIEAKNKELERVKSMYEFERALSSGAMCMGLDEVGRGPLAGPLTVAAVVLDHSCLLEGLNDSKQVPAARRQKIADSIKQHARAWSIQFIEASDIDCYGISLCLRRAFEAVIREVDAKLDGIESVLIDGNRLGIDPRETNVVKGDASCASIAAASLIAKVERDALMCNYACMYPQYGFDKNKGYGSAAHIEAIQQFGLTPIHRATFCSAYTQETLL